MDQVLDTIFKLAHSRRAKLAIGINNPSAIIIDSLQKANSFADIIVVGTKIDTLNSIETHDPELKLVQLLKDGTVEAIIRGQLDALHLRDYICSELNYERNSLQELGMLEDSQGRFFSLIPNVNSQGWTDDSKKALIHETNNLYIKLGIPIKVAVLAAVRPGSLGRNDLLDETYAQADRVVTWCQSQNISAKNYNIELEKALDDHCNVIVMHNGMVGNQVLRALLFVGGARAIGFTLSPMHEIVVESLRNEISFDRYLLFAAALVNKK